ncbi:hypothetical protein B484DRAFT_447993 [Ochromonadaceae sp. CCMP2298]|nr:hypothetical protein B484DRAFT_447993 [Ochromonadaceae sp. CCMP2298]|mmetsp:Transcript_14872/g.32822  ORF Transcript_14872/g.32822 Transcript_14872/m.32822 type:complete len:474 (-) Transcript_14872:67-1488(-)
MEQRSSITSSIASSQGWLPSNLGNMRSFSLQNALKGEVNLPWYFTFLFRLNVKTLVVSVLAALSAWMSYREGLYINLRGNNLVDIAVVLPIVFEITAAYQRREIALRSLAVLKANMFSIRLCYAHWSKDSRKTSDIIDIADDIIENFFEDLKMYLSGETVQAVLELHVLNAFSALSLLNEQLRKGGVSAPEMSRVSEYIRIMAVNFEIMKMIRIVRTPGCLRGFTKFWLAAIPILYGPVFAYIAKESGNVWPGIVLAVLYAVVLTALDTTQDILENPYDGDVDDIQFTKPVVLLSNRVSRPSLSDILPRLNLQWALAVRESKEDSDVEEEEGLEMKMIELSPLSEDEDMGSCSPPMLLGVGGVDSQGESEMVTRPRARTAENWKSGFARVGLPAIDLDWDGVKARSTDDGDETEDMPGMGGGYARPRAMTAEDWRKGFARPGLEDREREYMYGGNVDVDDLDDDFDPFDSDIG